MLPFVFALSGCARSVLLHGLSSSCRGGCSPGVWVLTGVASLVEEPRALGCVGFSSCRTGLGSCSSQALEQRFSNCGAAA